MFCNKVLIWLFFFFHRKFIPLNIIEEDSYEKDVLFYVNLGDPQMVGGNFFIRVDLERSLGSFRYVYANVFFYFL